MHKMNKKGQFLYMFLVIFFFFLAGLFVVMYQVEKQKEDLVGLRAINLIKSYDEAEKINLYIDLSAKYASKNSLKSVAENGGYNEGRCEKTQHTLIDQEQYVIWNTCPTLNPTKEFEIQFRKELKSFLEKYESSYEETDYESFFAMENTAQINYNQIYTDNVKKSTVENIMNLDNNFLINISDIILPVEEAEQSSIKLKPRTQIEIPNLSIYKRLHFTINNYCIKEDLSECREKLNEEFVSIKIIKEENLVKIKIPTQDYTIKLAFLPNNNIPDIQKTLF